ncbi:MAG: tRNA uridine-5-carboxymethylaminomethyl(34) synthesis GTPase MnmE [Clostridia bacterium]|nr:tRNA uridine-5-carboxymethylaminomethyl(34) synthesis GTPase MnmE [Clostridia bacterium]
METTMLYSDSTIFALSTAPQRSAIGVIRVSGGKAVDIVNKIFSRDISSAAQGLYYGFIMDGEEKIDEVMLAIFRGPKSFTGEDTVEISCHGGAVVISAISELLAKNGAVPAKNGEFTQRAFLNGKLDLTQAEAIIDLIDAETRSEAANAVKTLGGAMAQKIKNIRQPLVELSAKLFAFIDYPDDEIEDTEYEEIKNAINTAIYDGRKIMDTYSYGRYVSGGVKTVISGTPNVGKSSLLNALAGYDRSIVTDISGTTRDVVEETVVCGGLKLVLTDTAGIRETDDVVESIGVKKSYEQLEQADLIICVFDASREMNDDDREIIEKVKELSGVKIAVINKTDLAETHGYDLSGFENTVEISAKNKTGLEELEVLIKNSFAFNAPSDGSFMTNTRQYEVLCRAVASLENAVANMGITPDALLYDVEQAISALGELTGETASESILQNIFSRFCVGK